MTSRSTAMSSETLAITAPRTRSGLKSGIRRVVHRIDRVATPALIGTTAACIVVRLVILSAAEPSSFLWLPSLSTLLLAYGIVLTLSIPFAFLRARWYGWYAALATLLGSASAFAYSNGEYRVAHRPQFFDPVTPFYFVRQDGPQLAFAALLSAIVWLPIVLAVYNVRLPLSERMKTPGQG